MSDTIRKNSYRVEWHEYERKRQYRSDWWWGRTFVEMTLKYLTRDGRGKSPGWELWSRRPGSGAGSSFKPICRKLERRRAKQLIKFDPENDDLRFQYRA